MRQTSALLAAFLVVMTLACGSVGCEAGAGPALPAAGPNAIAVTIETAPPGATIVVDGVPVGGGPQTVTLNPGPHRIKASLSGYYPASEQKIQVGQGEPRTHTLTLVASH